MPASHVGNAGFSSAQSEHVEPVGLHIQQILHAKKYVARANLNLYSTEKSLDVQSSYNQLAVESILTRDITSWYNNCMFWKHGVGNIMKDSSYPAKSLFFPLWKANQVHLRMHNKILKVTYFAPFYNM